MSIKNNLRGVLIAGCMVALGLSSALAQAAQREEANKQVVLDFYTALNKADAQGNMAAKIQGIAQKYLSEDYHQNSDRLANLPGPGSHRDKLIQMFQNMPKMPALPAQTLLSIMAENDLVMMLTSRESFDPASGSKKEVLIFNMFRVKDGKLVEHWDISPAGGPPGQGPDASGAMPPPGHKPNK